MKNKTKRGKYHEWIEEDGLIKIEGWARDGLTNQQIAHNMGITSETLRVWSNKYSCISAALKNGKEVIDRHVENALLKRALGFKYTEVKEIRKEDENGNTRTETEKTVKYALPDTTAQIFWLKNRKMIEWRNKLDIDTEEQQARIDKLNAQTRTIEGLGKEIEDTSKLRELIGWNDSK